MIPKIIHYCWFGRGEMPQLAKDCIASWHKYMPDWEYKLWNEDNFDVNSVPYVKEAYEERKFAFVTDYVRLYALYTEGGIYMDTDVETLKSYEPLLNLKAFTGYEGSKYMPPVTGTMASEAGGEWVKKQLKEYDGLHFRKADGSLDMTTNTIRISDSMKKKGFIQDGKYQVFEEMHIFPSEYFCPRQTTGEFLLTENTYCDHHFMGTWASTNKSRRWFLRIIPTSMRIRMIKFKRAIIRG